MNSHPIRGKETPTSSIDDESSFDAAVFDTAVEHCYEKLDKIVMRLHRYPLDAIGVAMGMYLQELLRFLLDERQNVAAGAHAPCRVSPPRFRPTGSRIAAPNSRRQRACDTTRLTARPEPDRVMAPVSISSRKPE